MWQMANIKRLSPREVATKPDGYYADGTMIISSEIWSGYYGLLSSKRTC